jgi:hypothetical protein
MPSKSKSKKKVKSTPKASARSFNDRPVTMAFAGTQSFTGAGTYSLALNPGSLGGRVVSVADTYELYRIVKLRYRLIRNTGGVSGSAAVAYYPGITDTPPTTFFTVTENPQNAIVTEVSTTPSGWVNVKAEQLAGYQSWYKTIVGTPDPSVEIQGYLHAAATTTTFACFLQYDIEYQFKGPVPTGSTPAARRDAYVAKEYAKLMALLSAGGKGTRVPVPGGA